MNDNKKLINIDIGCGPNKKAGCIGFDCLKYDNVDYVLDVTKESLPLEDGCASYIFSSHFFEHINNPNLIFSEISRVLQMVLNSKYGHHTHILMMHSAMDTRFHYEELETSLHKIS